MPISTELEGLARMAHAAGVEIMRHYGGDMDVRAKSDESPVTVADEAAERIILAALEERWPGWPVIAEEATAAGRTPRADKRFFLVDPLDGTREFIAGRKEFTVNIALVEDGRPKAGVVYAPAAGRMYVGAKEEGALFAAVDPQAPFEPDRLAPLTRREKPRGESLRAVASRSHRDAATENWLKAHGIRDIVSAGSSLKLCLLAEGAADVYPRFGRTMEWDIAAGHAVLAAAGGQVLEAETGKPLRYGKAERGFDNPPFIAWAPGVEPC